MATRTPDMRAAYLKGIELCRQMRYVRQVMQAQPHGWADRDPVMFEIITADMHYLQACVFAEVEALEESGQ